MNPLVLSVAFGFLKGCLSDGGAPPYVRSKAYTHLGAPLLEEAAYRAVPFETARAAGLAMPGGTTAFAFALDHVLSEPKQGSGDTALRFADVFAGGMLYEMAYRRFGFFGAVLSHILHNVSIDLGLRSRHGR